MKRFLYAFSFATLLLLCVAGLSSGVRADIKIKMKMDGGSESTTYIKGKRQRMELGSGTATITQCDARRTVQLNAAAKTYIATPFDRNGVATPPTNANGAPPAPVKRGGVITSTVTAKDTGERQQMFGFTARRIKTSMITESSPDACSRSKSRIDSDGWYIDLPVEFNCETEGNAAAIALANGGGCRDEYRTKQIGTAKLGYPLKVTTTLYDENNQPQNAFTYEVVELSRTTLDAALFDVPADYREVRSVQELYGVSSSTGDEGGTVTDDPEDGTIATGGTTQAQATLDAKKEGVVRIGVAMTRADSIGEGMDAATLSEAVRNTMINRLRRGPAVEVVMLEARLPQQLDAEARRKECDYVLYTTATHKKGKRGGFGSLLQAAAPITDAIPLRGYGSRAGAVASSVATTAIRTAADVSAATKAKDELTLEYQLQPAQGNAPTAAQTLTAKAKTDGDDLISNLVGQAASAVLAQAT
ncbi:MAG: hypothetical protein H0T45_04310 [Pyrinomonadaceae bacterium]|nr:hypothetical protein [Pyrinomonadaceae bacterium]